MDQVYELTTGQIIEGTPDKFLYGIIAEYDQPEELIAACQKAYDAGYRKMDGYAPFPVDGLSEALGFHDHKVPLIMLIGGLCGCAFGFLLISWCTIVAYPLNIGGKPLFGWPSWLPITFECTVLFAAFSGLFGMFIVNGLPMPYHPVFDAPNFDRASSDKFFLCIETKDPRFDRVRTREFMETLGANLVSEVELKK